MKNSSTLITRIVAITGLALGAFALAAIAQDTGTWTAPTCAPPNCNTLAPINVGSLIQTKNGQLQVNNDNVNAPGLQVWGGGLFDNLSVMNNFIYTPNGNKPTPGQVLMAATSADGTVVWGDVAGNQPTPPTPPNSLTGQYCYAQAGDRWTPFGGLDGYYLKGMIKGTDNDWDGYGGVWCLPNGQTSDPRMTSSLLDTITQGKSGNNSGSSGYMRVIRSTVGESYNQIVAACDANPKSFRPVGFGGNNTITCPPYDLLEGTKGSPPNDLDASGILCTYSTAGSGGSDVLTFTGGANGGSTPYSYELFLPNQSGSYSPVAVSVPGTIGNGNWYNINMTGSYIKVNSSDGQEDDVTCVGP